MDGSIAPSVASNLIPGTIFTGAAEFITELGGDPQRIARKSGVPPVCLEDFEIPVRVDAVLDFFTEAAEECNYRQFGMTLAGRAGLHIFGPLWILMRSAVTVRQMLEDFGCNYDMFTRGATVAYVEKKNGAILSWDTVAQIGSATTQGAEYGFAMCVYELQKIDPKFVPMAVQFRHAAPSDISGHERVFGRNISFNQDCNAIHLSSSTLEIPLQSANSRARMLMRTMLSSDREGGPHGVASKVENVIRLLLPYSACSVSEVAHAIGISERTLQVRLQCEGTCFKEVKDSVRYDLALKYLQNSDLSLAEIADILGFSELSAFSRAFKRRHGASPRAARMEVGVGSIHAEAAIA